MPDRSPMQRKLDSWFPTIVRYAGIVLAVVIVLGIIFNRGGANIASGGVLALGMILYKTVKDAAEPQGSSGGEKDGGHS